MTWNERHFVSEWEEVVSNRADQIRLIAPWKVGTANRTCEQHIAHERYARR